MNGQWLGRYAGAQPGYVRANFDQADDHSIAAVYLTPENPTLPTMVLAFRMTGSTSFSLTTNEVEVAFVDPATGTPATRQRTRTQPYTAWIDLNVVSRSSSTWRVWVERTSARCLITPIESS